MLLLSQTCTGLITSRKRGCCVWQEVLAEGRGWTSHTWQLPRHLPLATLLLYSHRPLFVRIQQQPETKSTSASKKTGQGQPPAAPDSNPAHSGNRKHFLGKSRYSTACFKHPSAARCLGKRELSAGAVHQPAAWCELAPAVRVFQEPVTGLECSHCRWLTSKSPKKLQFHLNLWVAVHPWCLPSFPLPWSRTHRKYLTAMAGIPHSSFHIGNERWLGIEWHGFKRNVCNTKCELLHQLWKGLGRMVRSELNGTGVQGLPVELYLNYSSLQPLGHTFVFPLCTSVAICQFHLPWCLHARKAKNILESMAPCELEP